MITDFRFALRMLAKNPAFAIVAVLTLSIGIGSATVVFSAINALLLRPFPLVENQDRLLHVSQTAIKQGYDDMGMSYEDFADLRAQSTSLEGLWVFSDRTIIVTGTHAEPERLLGTELTMGAFTHLGVRPILGRDFTAADFELNSTEVALLNYSLWKRRFGGDAAVIDSVVNLNGRPTQIIGVMPEGWAYPERSDIWVPLRKDPSKGDLRGSYYLHGHAKLKPGATLAQAQAEADAIMKALVVAYPVTNTDIGVKLRSVRDQFAGDSRHLMLLLFGAVMFVFLIACLNVANLLLARAGARSREFALRLALGAERSRLIRQLLTESLLLAGMGAIGGLILSLWGVDLALTFIPVEIPYWLRFNVDATVFAFVSGLGAIAAIVFGLVPAFRATRPNLTEELKEGGRTGALASLRTNRLHHVLVVTEIAIALVLLVGAGLMMRSFLALRNVNPGFNAEQVLTFRTGLPPSMVTDKKVSRHFFGTLLENLNQASWVESASAISNLPGMDGNVHAFFMDGEPQPKHYSEAALAYHRRIDANYFATLQIPLLAGRLFTTRDQPETPKVAIVDEAFARKHFGAAETAIGKRVRLMVKEGADNEPFEIVGVVGSIRHRLDRETDKPTFYLPFSQDATNFMSVVIRTRSDPTGFIGAAQSEVIEVNREIPIYHAMPLDLVLLQTVWTRQFFGLLFAAFAAIALFLACIGIYGVMTFSVSQRTQEIGVRMALGAQPQEVIAMVVRQGLRLVSFGLVYGLAAAAIVAQLFAGIVYGVSPHDPPTFAAVPVLLALVALVACYIPSRRATRIDPMVALRAD